MNLVRKLALRLWLLAALLLVCQSLAAASYAHTEAADHNSAAAPAARPQDNQITLSYPFYEYLHPGSVIDHRYPNYQATGGVRAYTGEVAVYRPYDFGNHSLLCYHVGYQGSDNDNNRLYCYDGHNGLDIPTPSTYRVRSAHAGVAIHLIRDSGGYGLSITLQDKDNTQFYTLYGHNSSFLINQGDVIKRSQPISVPGNSGAAVGVHLHFSLYLGDPFGGSGPQAEDPYGWFGADADPMSSTGYAWASGQAANGGGSNSDQVNWNEGAVSGVAYFHRDRSYAGPFVVGALDSNWQIENAWANDHGNAGVPIADEAYNPHFGRNCQEFEGGIYCDDGSFQTNASSGFNDVPRDYWALRYIGWAKRENVINGYSDGSFRPNNGIARDEFAKMLVGTLGLTGDYSTRHYCDVSPASDFFYQQIEILYSNGIMTGQPGASCGFSNLYFFPHSNIKRGEMSKAIANAAIVKGWIGGIDSTVGDGGYDYADVPRSGSNYSIFYPYIETLYNKDVIKWRREYDGAGNGGRYQPSLDATRAQVAMFMHELVFHAPDGGRPLAVC